MKILLVEDEPFMIEAISHVLEHKGNEVTAVNNTDAAKKLLEKEVFGLVITDLYLPEPDGFGLVSFIKDNPETQSVPVLVVTGMVDHRETLKEKIPADGWLLKPFTLQQLTDAIRKYVEIEV